MEDQTPNTSTPTNGSAAAAADEHPETILPTDAELGAGGSMSNAEFARLSRERQETLLRILPPAVAAVLITNRPPMPPHIEYQAHRKLIAALARARAKIPSVPMDKTVDYVSKRTGERVHYSFSSLDSISKTVTVPLSEQGLVLECVFNGEVIVVLLSHEDGGIHLSWLPLPAEADIKDLATQITMRRRYLTVQILAIVADEDTGERDIEEPKKGAGQRRTPQGQQRRAAAPVGRQGQGAAGNRQQAQPGAQQLTARANALLTKLPKDVADKLRAEHKDPNELLRRTTEELNRRNAGPSGGDTTQNGDGASRAQTETPGTGTTASESRGQKPRLTDEQIEKHITEGMRQLKLSPDEQTTMRKEFEGNPRGLLEHIKALYRAGQDNNS